jgi:hypothetical protein
MQIVEFVSREVEYLGRIIWISKDGGRRWHGGCRFISTQSRDSALHFPVERQDGRRAMLLTVMGQTARRLCFFENSRGAEQSTGRQLCLETDAHAVLDNCTFSHPSIQ